MSSVSQCESPDSLTLDNAPGLYQQTYSLYPTPVYVQSGLVPANLGQQRPPGPPDDRESSAQLQILLTQMHLSDAHASQLEYVQAKNPHLWMSGNAPGRHQGQYSLYPAPVYVQSGFVPVPLGQQRLLGPPDDGESAAQRQALPMQVHSNDAVESQLLQAQAERPHLWMSGNAQGHYQGLYSLCPAPIQVQPGFVPAPLDHQRLPGPPDDGENPVQPQFWEGEGQPNDMSQLSPHGSTGSAQEQSPGTAQSAGAQEAEPHRQNSTAGGEQYACKPCVKSFQRSQELVRHIREVHDSKSPRKCPFCPPFRRPWKRPYLLKEHLMNDHREEFAEDLLERIRILKGKNVFAFVETIVKYRASTVINASPHESSMGVVEDDDEGAEEIAEPEAWDDV